MPTKCYQETGWREEAAEMEEKSRQFYDKIRINVPLTEREIKIVKIIESKEYENMEIIVDNLFENKNQVPTNGYI